MPVVMFRGGPLSGETWNIPTLIAGAPMTYRTENGRYDYVFSGRFLDSARLYHIEGFTEPEPWPSAWPEREARPE